MGSLNLRDMTKFWSIQLLKRISNDVVVAPISSHVADVLFIIYTETGIQLIESEMVHIYTVFQLSLSSHSTSVFRI